MPKPDETATDLQQQLAEIGIRVTLDKQETGTFIGNANSGLLTGLFLLGWGADYPDVTNFLDYHFGSGCTSALGACYPEIYEPLQTGATSNDEANAHAGVHRCEQRDPRAGADGARSRMPTSQTHTWPGLKSPRHLR